MCRHAAGCPQDIGPAHARLAFHFEARLNRAQPHADPAGLLDLPAGFSSRVLSSLGDALDDGGTVPDRADGMGCFDIGNGEIALVRNHELRPGKDSGGASGATFDRMPDGSPMPGGTTNMIAYDIGTVRKRGQAKPTVTLTAQAGSWDHYATQVDVGGPLNEAGTLRGRSVISYNNANSYLDTAQKENQLFYGIIEADLADEVVIEQRPRLEGRQMIMMVAPKKK